MPNNLPSSTAVAGHIASAASRGGVTFQQEDAALSLVIDAAFNGQLPFSVQLIDQHGPVSVARQLLFAPLKPLRHEHVWPARRNDYFIEHAKAIKTQEITDKKPSPLLFNGYTISSDELFFFDIKVLTEFYDTYNIEPTPEEQQLRQDLGLLYDKYARIFAAIQTKTIKAMLSNARDELAKRHYLVALKMLYLTKHKLIKVLEACTPKFMPEEFQEATVFDKDLLAIGNTVLAFSTSEHEVPNALATAIVAAALQNGNGTEVLFETHKQRIIKAMTTHFTKEWYKFFAHHDSETQLPDPQLLPKLLATDLCQNMVALIRGNLENIDNVKYFVRLGFWTSASKQLCDSHHIGIVLARMIRKAPGNDYKLQLEFPNYLEPDIEMGGNNTVNSANVATPDAVETEPTVAELLDIMRRLSYHDDYFASVEEPQPTFYDRVYASEEARLEDLIQSRRCFARSSDLGLALPPRHRDRARGLAPSPLA